MSFRLYWLASLVATSISGVISVKDGNGQTVMEPDRKKFELVEFMKVFKQAAEAGAFADPLKLNEMIPMAVQWQTPEERRGSPWLGAKSVALESRLIEPDNLRYLLREPNEWVFSASRMDQIACITFDEAVAVWGGSYQIGPIPQRRYSQGAPIRLPGPQKMADRGITYRFVALERARRIGLQMSFDGCVESIGTGQD